LGALALVLISACQLIVGVDPLDAADVHVPCPSALRPPPGPPPCDAGTPGCEDDTPSLAFALTSVFLHQPDGGAIGYDLDDRCTGPDATDVPCVVSPRAGEFPISFVDEPYGVDNLFGQITGLVRDFGAPSKSDLVTESAVKNINSGRFTELVFMMGYNGTPDDPRVDVSLVTSALLVANTCDAGYDPGVRPRVGMKPAGDGCDLWSWASGLPRVDDGGVTQTGVPKGPEARPSRPGYVKGDVLFVPLGLWSFSLGRGTTVRLEGAVMRATIVRDSGVVRLTDGLIAGRANVEDLIKAAGETDQAGTPICTAPVFDTVKQILCNAPDLPASATDDGRGKACTHVSFAVGFTATEVKRVGPEISVELAKFYDLGDASDPCATLDAGCSATN
jgi:hypothetical protein